MVASTILMLIAQRSFGWRRSRRTRENPTDRTGVILIGLRVQANRRSSALDRTPFSATPTALSNFPAVESSKPVFSILRLHPDLGVLSFLSNRRRSEGLLGREY